MRWNRGKETEDCEIILPTFSLADLVVFRSRKHHLYHSTPRHHHFLGTRTASCGHAPWKLREMSSLYLPQKTRSLYLNVESLSCIDCHYNHDLFGACLMKDDSEGILTHSAFTPQIFKLASKWEISLVTPGGIASEISSAGENALHFRKSWQK